MKNDAINTQIAYIIKHDRKLLITSVKNLTKVMKQYLPEEEYKQLLKEQEQFSFWRIKNLQNFYDHYIQYWDELRLTKQN